MGRLIDIVETKDEEIEIVLNESRLFKRQFRDFLTKLMLHEIMKIREYRCR